VRFYTAEPEAITCMAHCGVSPQLAVARADSTVEVWHTGHSLVRQKILGSAPGEQASVESLAWGAGKLYSCGLHGQVVEYDLGRQCEMRRHPVTSGPAWCLAIDGDARTMAVGTEEGFVCLFNLTTEGLEYSRVLDRQEGRILCLAWHSDGVHIATGSTDTIRIWNTTTGHPTARMTTGRTERNKETIVWCVAFTADMTVISGDSRGKTSFWNGKNGTLMDSIQSHKADVLAIAVSQDQTKAYSSGVDPTLMHFQIIQKSDGRTKWVKSLHRVISTHDVRSLVSVGDRLYTGGVDTYLQISIYPGRHVIRLPCLPPPSSVGVATDSNLLLLPYSSRLEVWRLGSTSYHTGGLGNVLPLDSQPDKLLVVEAKSGERIVCSAIHTKGTWLSYSTDTRLRLLRLSTPQSNPQSTSQPSVSRVSVPGAGLASQLALYSVENQDRLIVCLRDGGLVVYSLEEESVEVISTHNSAHLGLEGGVARISLGDTHVLVADHNDTVVAFDLKSNEVSARLPSYSESALACFSLAPNSKTAVLVYANQKIMEVSLSSGRYTQFSTSLSSKLPRGWMARKTAVTGVTHIRGNDDLIMIHDDSTLAVLDKDKELPEPHAKLVYSDPRSTPSDELSQDGTNSSYCPSLSPSSVRDANYQAVGLRMSRKYRHLLSFIHLAGDQVVAVEVKPSTVEEMLPPSLKQKKFGGS